MPVDLLALGLGAALAHAEPAPERMTEPDRPPLALLEFLGSWETPDGGWVDPDDLAQMDLDDSARVRTEETDRPAGRTGSGETLKDGKDDSDR